MDKNIPKWLAPFLDSAKVETFDYRVIDGILTQGKGRESNVGDWGQSRFAGQSLVPFTTTWCEHQLGEQLLDQALDKLPVTPKNLYGDLGSGDGRYVRALLNRGAKKIVALNFEIEPLLSLRASLTIEDLDRVALICGDVNTSPLKPEIFDFTVAWALFSSAEDFKETYESAISLTHQGGWLLSAEPVLEHHLIYALIMGDFGEFVRALQEKSRPFDWLDKDKRYRLNSLNQVRELMSSSRSTVAWEKGISVLPSLLFGGLGTQSKLDEDKKRLAWSLMKEMNQDLSWHRQVVFLSERTG